MSLRSANANELRERQAPERVPKTRQLLEKMEYGKIAQIAGFSDVTKKASNEPYQKIGIVARFAGYGPKTKDPLAFINTPKDYDKSLFGRECPYQLESNFKAAPSSWESHHRIKYGIQHQNYFDKVKKQLPTNL